MMPRFFDTHVHLDHERFDEDRGEVLRRAAAAGVTRMVQVASDLPSSRRSVDLVREVRAMGSGVPELWCAVGIHPHDADTLDGDAEAQLNELLEHKAEHRIVAVGEIGLDYHYDLSPREDQIRAFSRQLEMARSHGLPVIVHDRDAHADCLAVLREAGYDGSDPAAGVFHCYSGSPETAREIRDMGFYIGLDGPLTFRNARRAPDVVREADPDRLLIETDCPFLSPEPYRGQRNEPARVVEVLKVMARLRGVPEEEMALRTWDNACRLFGLDP